MAGVLHENVIRNPPIRKRRCTNSKTQIFAPMNYKLIIGSDITNLSPSGLKLLLHIFVHSGRFITQRDATSRMDSLNLVNVWIVMMTAAFVIALTASLPPRRPLASWLGDFFVRLGLAGLFVWFVTTGLWAVRELMNMRLILPFSYLESVLEYYTYWAAALTGLATFIFFGATLMLNAIFAKPEASAAQTAQKAPVAVVIDRRIKSKN
jgi:hypothetical protein